MSAEATDETVSGCIVSISFSWNDFIVGKRIYDMKMLTSDHDRPTQASLVIKTGAKFGTEIIVQHHKLARKYAI